MRDDPVSPSPATGVERRPTVHRLVIVHACSFRERLIGLLGAPPLAPGHALRIAPCRAVHTAGMRHAIDVVFVGRDDRVRAVHGSLRPWRAAACLSACAVLELRQGEASRLGIVAGDRIAVGERLIG